MTAYHFGPFCLNPEQLILSVDGVPLALGPKVVETLLALVERPGEVLGKNELLDRVWPEGFVEEANLAQNVYVIRKALRAYWEDEAIATVPRRGYRFIPAVSVRSKELEAPLAASASWKRYPAIAAAALVAAIGIGAVQGSAWSRPHESSASVRLSSAGARLYAIGKFYWNQRTRDGIEKSVRYFELITRLDPRSARGYAALAEAYAISADYGYGRLGAKQAYARARSYAKHALRIDPDSAEAHAALGIAQDMPKHRASAQAEYRRAIALDPTYAPAHQWYGISLLFDGKGGEAFAELQEAANLDPVSVSATAWLAQAAYFARRYRDSIAFAQQTLDLSPRRSDVYIPMGLAYEASGDFRAAISAYNRYGASCKACRPQAAALLAHAFAAVHDEANARMQLQIAQRGVAKRDVDPHDVVMALVAMGRRTEALRMLQRDSHDVVGALLGLDPRMDPVRHDARFRAYTQGPA